MRPPVRPHVFVCSAKRVLHLRRHKLARLRLHRLLPRVAEPAHAARPNSSAVALGAAFPPAVTAIAAVPAVAAANAPIAGLGGDRDRGQV